MPVGAVAAYLVALTAQTSLRTGVFAALGVATADGVYALIAVCGGAALAAVLRPVTLPLRRGSAVVLIVLAVHGTVAAVRRHRERRDGTGPAGRRPARCGPTWRCGGCSWPRSIDTAAWPQVLNVTLSDWFSSWLARADPGDLRARLTHGSPVSLRADSLGISRASRHRYDSLSLLLSAGERVPALPARTSARCRSRRWSFRSVRSAPAGWADQDARGGCRGELIRIRVLAVRTASERVLMS